MRYASISNTARMIRSLMLDPLVALTFAFRDACLKDPLRMVDLLGSLGTSIPISCLILLIRSSLSSFSGSQYRGA